MYQSDPVSFWNIVVALSAGLLVATVDLVIRAIQHSNRMGGGAVTIGALVILFSFFGLLLGVASIGVVGAMLVLAGRPIKQTNSKRATGNAPSWREPGSPERTPRLGGTNET
jgi:hypothetical protein